jgi:hypothetical protein
LAPPNRAINEKDTKSVSSQFKLMAIPLGMLVVLLLDLGNLATIAFAVYLILKET